MTTEIICEHGLNVDDGCGPCTRALYETNDAHRKLMEAAQSAYDVLGHNDKHPVWVRLSEALRAIEESNDKR